MQMSERDCPPIQSVVDSRIRILCHAHRSSTIFLLLIFSYNLKKHAKTILSSQVAPQQAEAWFCPWGLWFADSYHTRRILGALVTHGFIFSCFFFFPPPLSLQGTRKEGKTSNVKKWVVSARTRRRTAAPSCRRNAGVGTSTAAACSRGPQSGAQTPRRPLPLNKDAPLTRLCVGPPGGVLPARPSDRGRN